MALNLPRIKKIVGLGNKEDPITIEETEEFITIPAENFTAENPNSDDVTRGVAGGRIQAQADGIRFFAPVNLPSGSTIIEVIVYGNAAATAEIWGLYRANHTGGANEKAAENIGTADTSITDPIVNNEDNIYYILTSSLDTNDTIYGARIKYLKGILSESTESGGFKAL